MKKVFLLLAMLLAFTSIGLGQGSGPITVKEVDGSPVCNNCRTLIFPNGSLTVSGNKVTVASGGGGGTGDVVGPASATDNAVVRFNTTTGKLVQNSVVLIGDTGNVTGLGTLNTHTIPGGTDTFALLAASQSLLNKKLGSLTSNGLVTTSSGDGTLGVTVPGTGVLTALGVNVGSAGAFVTFNGAGGTPSSITLTNGSGLPLSTGVTGDLPFANFVQAGSAGFVGATGAGDYSHRTPTQVTAALDAMVGDSGSGGTKGLVPAPSAGDAAASKFLKADGTWATAGGGGSPGGSNTQLQYNNSSAFGGISGATSDGTTVTLTSPTINTGITLNAAPLTMSGNISAAAWTTSGIRIKGTSVTLTDTSSSGTVASAYTNVLGGNTIAASSSTTFTNYYSTFLNAPAAGSNVTLTNGWALGMSGAQQVIRDSLGTTNATGIELINNTAAAAGAQQISPDLIFTAQGWKTTATAASQTVNWRAYVLPIQGTTAPTSNLIFAYQVNSGGYNNTVTLGQGTLAITNGVHGTATLTVATGALATSQFAATNGITWGNGWGQLSGGGGSTAIMTTAGSIDIRLTPTSRTLIVGGADGASPGAYTIATNNVAAGTSNTAGANWTFAGSRGTGTGAGGDVIIQTAPAGSTGSTQNTLVTAFTVKGNGAVQLQSVTFTNLPTVANGYLIYCSDCTLASPCASGGSGALAKGINGAWVCN